MLRGSKSQEDFSKEIGVAKATIQALEAQRTAIRLDTLELICNSLSISPQEVLSDAAQPLELDILSRYLERTDWFLMLGQKSSRSTCSGSGARRTISAALPAMMGGRRNRHGLSACPDAA